MVEFSSSLVFFCDCFLVALLSCPWKASNKLVVRLSQICSVICTRYPLPEIANSTDKESNQHHGSSMLRGNIEMNTPKSPDFFVGVV
jgi:hypothetical protein